MTGRSITCAGFYRAVTSGRRGHGDPGGGAGRGHPTASTIADRVAGASGGNPFFVEEIVRDLVGRSVLEGSRGQYRLVGRLTSIDVPSTVQSVIAARSTVRPDEKSALNAAAVIGSGFDLDVLRAPAAGRAP